MLSAFKSSGWYSFMLSCIYLYFFIYHIMMDKSLNFFSWILIAVMLFFARFVQADEEVERKRKERDNLYTFIYYAGIVFSHLYHFPQISKT